MTMCVADANVVTGQITETISCDSLTIFVSVRHCKNERAVTNFSIQMHCATYCNELF